MKPNSSKVRRVISATFHSSSPIRDSPSLAAECERVTDDRLDSALHEYCEPLLLSSLLNADSGARAAAAAGATITAFEAALAHPSQHRIEPNKRTRTVERIECL